MQPGHVAAVEIWGSEYHRIKWRRQLDWVIVAGAKCDAAAQKESIEGRQFHRLKGLSNHTRRELRAFESLAISDETGTHGTLKLVSQSFSQHLTIQTGAPVVTPIGIGGKSITNQGKVFLQHCRQIPPFIRLI